MRQPRLAVWFAAAAGVCIVLAGAGVAFRWTLIPLRLDSRVVGRSWIDSTTIHLWTLDLADGRTITVDHEVIGRVGGDKALFGAKVRKQRWERHVTVDGTRVPLSIPLDFWLTVAGLSVPVTMGWWLRRGSRRRQASDRLPT